MSGITSSLSLNPCREVHPLTLTSRDSFPVKVAEEDPGGHWLT